MTLRSILLAGLSGASVFLSGAAFAQTIPPITDPSSNGGISGISATEPRYGTPNSMEFQAVSASLDLFTMDQDDVGGGTGGVGGAIEPDGDADTIGGALTYFDAGFQHGERYEGRYQHAQRFMEGSRARLLIDVPVDVLHADHFSIGPVRFGGGTAVYGTLNVGVEIPVQPNWFITPRVAYSNLQAGAAYAFDGELATGSVTSRYKIPQVGRGDLTIGNMIAYTHTINTFLSKQPFFSSGDDWVFRNGLAYQLPLKARLFGRQASVRGSYVFTYTTGEPGLAFKQVHEFGVSVGVRTREVEQKNRFEQFRIGLLYTAGKNEFSHDADLDSFTLTLGYRF